ncbi:MAG: hypothetical protein ABR517_00180, partial [Thermoanaerobaculia bacterium]
MKRSQKAEVKAEGRRQKAEVKAEGRSKQKAEEEVRAKSESFAACTPEECQKVAGRSSEAKTPGTR